MILIGDVDARVSILSVYVTNHTTLIGVLSSDVANNSTLIGHG